MTSVGVRELRQNASELLNQVESTGEGITITNHGKPVARLVPLQERWPMSRSELLRSGLLTPGRGNVLDVEPVELPPGSTSLSSLLAEDRSDD